MDEAFMSGLKRGEVEFGMDFKAVISWKHHLGEINKIQNIFHGVNLVLFVVDG
jgi:hypothetical protein